jgi:hypothetical protein
MYISDSANLHRRTYIIYCIVKDLQNKCSFRRIFNPKVQSPPVCGVTFNAAWILMYICPLSPKRPSAPYHPPPPPSPAKNIGAFSPPPGGRLEDNVHLYISSD